MIKNIDKIKGLGVFDNFNGLSDDFLKFNLFYGWNGCGKTTLSSLFYDLSTTDNVISEYGNPEFGFTLEDGIKINQNNYKDNILLNLNVFNKNFIEDNINWNDTLKSILLISKGNIDDINKLEKFEKEFKDYHIKYKSFEDKLEENNQNIDKELSKKARDIKLSFQTIDTNDNYYLNYNKAKLKDFLNKNKSSIIKGSYILDDDTLKLLSSSIKPNDKTYINNLSFKDLKLDLLDEVENKVEILIKSNITEGIIDRLKNNSDISNWIEAGLELHKNHGESKCEFCGNDINNERLEKLKNHFSDEVKDLRQKLLKAKEYIFDNIILSKLNYDKTYFYSDFQSSFSLLLIDFNREVDVLNSIFNNWLLLIEEKIKNPAIELNYKKLVISGVLEKYNDVKLKILELIKKHNTRVGNYESELKSNQKKLELHFSSEFNKDTDYYNILIDNLALKKDLETYLKLKNDKNEKIINLKSKLSNETLGSDSFNLKLSKFLGNKEIRLEFNKSKKGYEIIRSFDGKKASNLSEGEKTAIAFVYFITKLEEKNDLSSEIVFIDDPISSFDSNNIFSAYSFIKSELEGVEQLFITTHNFSFFKLLRDWFLGKNNRKKKDGTYRSNQSMFFQIKTEKFLPKKSIIELSCNTLIDYNSEYHYVFKKLYGYKDDINLTLDKSFETSNLGRKLLESFLTFKFPKKRNDFRQLLQVATGKDIQLEEKVFKFINKYSHLQVVSFLDDSENNQLGESSNIINDILGLIEKVDKGHYDELVQLSSN